MGLVNEYLRAVAALLPKAQREDITAELRDTILSRIEEREAELDHPLSDGEIEAVLHEVGHPILVAARYREGPQHAVGPALYPYWAFAVKIAVTIQAIIAVCNTVIRLLGGHSVSQAIGAALGAAFTGTVFLIGLATIAGWLVERRRVEVGELQAWRVRDLYLLEFASWSWDDLRQRLAAGRTQVMRGRARPSSVSRGIACIVAGAMMILWWVGGLPVILVGDPGDLPALGLNAGALASLDWVAFKAMIFWPFVGYFAIMVLLGVVILARPRALGLVGLLDTALGASLVAFAGWLWTDSPLASAIQVDSVTGFAMMMRQFKSWPTPIAPVVTIVVLILAIGGLARLIRGVWEMASAVGPRQGQARA
jgi:hypothetical protein